MTKKPIRIGIVNVVLILFPDRHFGASREFCMVAVSHYLPCVQHRIIVQTGKQQVHVLPSSVTPHCTALSAPCLDVVSLVKYPTS